MSLERTIRMRAGLRGPLRETKRISLATVMCLCGVAAAQDTEIAQPVTLALQPPIGRSIPWVWEEEYSVSEHPGGSSRLETRHATVVFRFVADVIFQRAPQGLQAKVTFRRPSLQLRHASGTPGDGLFSESRLIKTGTVYHVQLDPVGIPQDLTDAEAMMEEMKRSSTEAKRAHLERNWIVGWVTSAWAVTFGYHGLLGTDGIELNTTHPLVRPLRHRLPGFGAYETLADAVPLHLELGMVPAGAVDARMDYRGWYRFSGKFPLDPMMRQTFNLALLSTFPFMTAQEWKQGELRGGGVVVVDKETRLPLDVRLRHRLVLSGARGEEVHIEQQTITHFVLSARSRL